MGISPVAEPPAPPAPLPAAPAALPPLLTHASSDKTVATTAAIEGIPARIRMALDAILPGRVGSSRGRCRASGADANVVQGHHAGRVRFRFHQLEARDRAVGEEALAAAQRKR